MPCLTCTICSEVYSNNDVIYSTACGHIFHFACMQQWRSRSTSCPQCREHNPTTHRIFLDFEETANEQKLNETQTLLDQTQKSRSELQLQLDEAERNVYDMQRLLVEAEEKNTDLESANQYLKAQNESREDEIGKLINNCNLKASEEAELLRVQLTSLEERLKDILLELEQKSEECLKLYEASNKHEKLVERNDVLYASTRRQYEAVEKGLKVQIEHLKQEVITKTTIIDDQKKFIAELSTNEKSSEKSAESDNLDCEFKKQNFTSYIDNNSTEIRMQKLKLERELEKSSDKILELEESHIRNMEMLNLEIESLKADIERKDNEIKNRKDEHAKMMNRLSTLGSKATEISLRKRNEILINKLEETRCELEKAFKSCAEKDAAILKLKQSETIEKSNLDKSANKQLQNKVDSSEKKSINKIIKQSLDGTLFEDQKIESNNTKIVTSVFLTGVPKGDIKNPLINTVLMYTEIMGIPCNTADIRGVFEQGPKEQKNKDQKEITCLHVKFATLDKKVKFLTNRDMLRPRGIHVAEYREDKEKNALFHHAKKLRAVGYSTVFCKNNKVFVKLNKKAPLIKINCMRDVDDLAKESKPPQNEECDDNYYRV
ncbi:myosin heavy chain, clone 203-like [Eurosta solidaginis]|uniref:myosin heavy chain, clone 203-like n=1 Tax=Eurosta solidaginis TaxID=178769 RepID=UPI00353096DF